MKVTGIKPEELKQLRDTIIEKMRRDRRPPEDTTDQQIVDDFVQDMLVGLMIQHESEIGTAVAHAATAAKWKGKRF